MNISDIIEKAKLEEREYKNKNNRLKELKDALKNIQTEITELEESLCSDAFRQPHWQTELMKRIKDELNKEGV